MMTDFKELEEPDKYTYETSRISGEEIRLEKRICVCGHVLSFLRPYPQTCNHCGRLVYPNKKIEFMNKMKRKLKI